MKMLTNEDYVSECLRVSRFKHFSKSNLVPKISKNKNINTSSDENASGSNGDKVSDNNSDGQRATGESEIKLADRASDNDSGEVTSQNENRDTDNDGTIDDNAPFVSRAQHQHKIYFSDDIFKIQNQNSNSTKMLIFFLLKC